MHAGDTARRLAKEYKSVSTKDATRRLGFEVDLVDDSLYHWKVKLINFDGMLAQDLNRVSADHVQLEVKFDSDYPNKPPFVRVVTPKFKFHTGHVTIGGSICTELLTNSSSSNGWKAAITMESVILTVRQLLIDGKAKIEGRGSYSEAAAREAFDRVAKQHGWVNRSRQYVAAGLIFCAVVFVVALTAQILLK